MVFVVWLVLANQSALFQSRTVTLILNLLMTEQFYDRYKKASPGGAAIAQWIRVPSTSTTLFIYSICVNLSCEKKENKQKEARFGPFFK